MKKIILVTLNIICLCLFLCAYEQDMVVSWGNETSIIDQAVEQKSMIICFMSGEGLKISGQSEADNTFLETKWGDSSLIVFPDGQTMLIDGGMSDYAPLLIANLKALGLNQLDYVMLSHRHDDHWGGLLRMGGIIETFKPKTVFSSGILNAGASEPYKLEAVTKNNGGECVYLRQGDQIAIGEVTMDILWPEPPADLTLVSGTEALNSSSLVAKFTYKDITALFVGDLYAGGEQQLIDSLGVEAIDTDIIKIPHHGRTTSSSSVFIKAVTAKVGVATGAIIMDPSVYTRWESKGTAVYMDAYDGYVKVSTDGTSIEVLSSRIRPEIPAYTRVDKAFKIQH